VAGMGVALFAGFVALTKWTGDEPGSVDALDEQEQGDLFEFCSVFSTSSGYLPYDLVLRVASGEAVGPDELADVGIFDSTGAQSLALSQIDLLADRVPEEYGADARHAAEGLERALDGDLDADEVEEYVASFDRLEARAAEDCDAVEGIGGGGPFGEDGDGGGGPFDDDGDGGFGGDGGEGPFGGDGNGPPGPPPVPSTVSPP